MAKKQTPGSREQGRRTARVSFSAAGELVDQMQQLADEEGATLSRVMDRLLRTGLAAEQAGGFLDRASERIVHILQRLDETTAIVGAFHVDFASEQKLIATAMMGHEYAQPLLKALDPSVFALDVHQMAWQLLRDGTVEAGPNAFNSLSKAILPALPSNHLMYTINELYEADYLQSLSDTMSEYPDWAIDGLRPAAAAVVHAFAARSWHGGPRPLDALNSFLLAQSLRGREIPREEGRNKLLELNKAFRFHMERSAAVIDFKSKADRSGTEG